MNKQVYDCCIIPLQFQKIGQTPDLPVPCARSGHRVVADDANLYAIGGYNPEYRNIENDDSSYYPLFRELWRFNFANRGWKNLKTDDSMPYELASHTAHLVGSSLMMFGGTGVPFGSSSSHKLHICNLKTLAWTQLACSGEYPDEKYGHMPFSIVVASDGRDVAVLCINITSTLIGHHLYVFGGTSGFIYNNDVHQLNLRTGEWMELSNDCGPSARYRHEMATDGKLLYAFGGGTAVEVNSLDKIPVFDPTKEKWEELVTVADATHGFPVARRCHSLVHWKHSVYICGGLSRSSDDVTYFILDDIWCFSLLTHQWTRLPSRMPQPVYFHSAAVTQAGCMYIFGGVTLIDDERTNDIYRLWLDVPPLQELCWHSITSSCLPNLSRIPKIRLLELGIPRHLIERIT